MGRPAFTRIGRPVLASLADRGMSQDMIARELQVSRDLVRKWLADYGLKTKFRPAVVAAEDLEPFSGERTRPTAFAIACARPFDPAAWQAVHDMTPLGCVSHS